MKVVFARMPPAFSQFTTKIDKLDKKLILPRETAYLIRQQVSGINLCSFCVDFGRWASIKASMNQAKFDSLEQYSRGPHFTDKERAALDYATNVNPDTFARLSRYYSEREICEIVWLVASEHFYNITNIGLNIESDMLCDISKERRVK